MMNIGNISIHLFSDGTMKMDGGSLFGPIPKREWENYLKSDRLNRVQLSVNTMLLRTPNANMLIGAGVGSKRRQEMQVDYGFNRSRLAGALRDVGLNARNVDIVAYPNTKFDYIGGGTKHDRDSVPVPTFRNATYVMQKEALKAAKAPNYRYRHAFFESDFGPLEEREMVKFVEDGDTIIPGVTVKEMDGVMKGNLVFYIQYGCERIMYVGDVIPTRFHLELDHIQADAESPNRLIEQKQYLIKQAVEEGWLMVFGKERECPAAYLHLLNGELKAKRGDI